MVQNSHTDADERIMQFIEQDRAVRRGCREIIIMADPDYLKAVSGVERYISAQVDDVADVSWDRIVSAVVDEFNRVLPDHLQIKLR